MEKKFRVWTDNKMIYPHEHNKTCGAFTQNTPISYHPNNICDGKNNTDFKIIKSVGAWNSDWDNQVVMQCTTFLDKNGKEIYEGDIVKDGSIKYPYLKEVYWDDRFQWSLRLVHYGNQFSSSLSNDKYIVPEEMRIEVIGNVYQNTELLKKQEN